LRFLEGHRYNPNLVGLGDPPVSPALGKVNPVFPRHVINMRVAGNILRTRLDADGEKSGEE
jgi:hypothetical protein